MSGLLKGRVGQAALLVAAGAGAVVAFNVLAKPSNDIVWSQAPVDASAQASPLADMPSAGSLPGDGNALPAEDGSTAHGVIQSENEAVIASRMTALITSMPLEAGQSFARGQTLVGFDCQEMKAQMSAASAAETAYRKTYDTNVELDHYKAIGTNEVDVSRANLGKAAAEARVIQAGLGQCAIVAPFAGSVVERIAHPHDVAAPGQPLMKIQGSGNLKIELIIPSKWITWVKPGTPFHFAVDETGQSIEGRITRLGAAVDPVSKTLRVTGSIVRQGTVLPGMSGTAHFNRS